MAPLRDHALTELHHSIDWFGEECFHIAPFCTTKEHSFDGYNLDRVAELAKLLHAQGSPSAAIAITYHGMCFAMHLFPGNIWVFDPHGNCWIDGPARGCSTWALFINIWEAVEYLKWNYPPFEGVPAWQNYCQLVGYW